MYTLKDQLMQAGLVSKAQIEAEEASRRGAEVEKRRVAAKKKFMKQRNITNFKEAYPQFADALAHLPDNTIFADYPGLLFRALRTRVRRTRELLTEHGSPFVGDTLVVWAESGNKVGSQEVSPADCGKMLKEVVPNRHCSMLVVNQQRDEITVYTKLV